MTDTPSDAAKRKACELAQKHAHDDPNFYKPKLVEPYNPTLYALALYIDEVDRVARELEDGAFRLARPVIQAKARSLMLPDPPDPDEELAREVAMHVADDGKTALGNAADAALATIKRLRADGRLTDAK